MNIHEGTKFLCNQCDYKVGDKGNLTHHMKFVHEGISHPCNQCEYKGMYKKDLQKHIKTQHSE